MILKDFPASLRQRVRLNINHIKKQPFMVKIIFQYALWTLAALLLGIGYMWMILGSAPEQTDIWSFLVSRLHLWGLMHIGLAIGAIVATFFILLDAFYLKKKWASSGSLFSLRATTLLLIFVFVGTLHYLLEKIWDVI